ncbi:MAG: hypothetical protein KIT58_03975 [Planctomycetota bacterium]|nr:hypothetical protein [Planctomycetota bacterium]
MTDVPSDVPSGGRRVKFDYIKSNYFRVVHADGFWGGLNGMLDLRMSVWNERAPIPQQVTHVVTEAGQLGPEVRPERISRGAVVREVEVDIVMSYEVAKGMHQWLGKKLEQYEKLVEGVETVSSEAEVPENDRPKEKP